MFVLVLVLGGCVSISLAGLVLDMFFQLRMMLGKPGAVLFARVFLHGCRGRVPLQRRVRFGTCVLVPLKVLLPDVDGSVLVPLQGAAAECRC